MTRKKIPIKVKQPFNTYVIDGKLVDDSTTVVTVPTPKGWKCARNGCTTDFKHRHSTYPALDKQHGEERG